MENVLANARARLWELEAETAKIRQFIEMFERFSSTAPGALTKNEQRLDQEQTVLESNSEDDPLPVVNGIEPQVSEYAPPSRGLPRRLLRPHLLELFREIGHPLTRGQLLKELDARGIPVGGTYNRSKNMGTIMWRLREDFISLDGFGYWPRFASYLPASYDPDQQPKGSAGQEIEAVLG